MSRGRRARVDRRLAGTVVGLTLAGLGLAAVHFSCARAERRTEADLTIPRDLAGAPVIRVALVRGAPRASIEVRGPYEIYASDAADARPAFAGAALPAVDVALEPEPKDPAAPGIALGTTVFRPGIVRIVAKETGTLVVDGTAYRGDLVVRALASDKERGVLVVNRVNLEEYVAGVVGSEMPLLFPEAALRAQAIASRTYGLHAWRARLGAGEALFDVMDDQSSQVYKGLANETDRARQVTLDTLGVVLAYRGRVLNAYFHSTCGGETIPAAWVFGDASIPPLMGGPCGFCTDSKYYRWRHEERRADLQAKLAKEGFPVAAVSKVEVIERGPGGHVATARVLHPGGELRIKGTRLRRVVGTSSIRSTAFDVADGGGETVVFEGKGWGHGVGMCQIGARGMAKAGHDALAIVRRYYPAAEVVRAYAVPGTGTGAGTENGRP